METMHAAWSAGLAGVLLLAGCTDGSSSSTTTSSSTGGPTQTVELSIAPESLRADGMSRATVTIRTRRDVGATVRLSVDKGKFQESMLSTLSKATDGQTSVVLIACAEATAGCSGTGTVTAEVGGVSGSVTFTLITSTSGSSSGPASSMGASSGVQVSSSAPPGSSSLAAVSGISSSAASSSSGGMMAGRIRNLQVAPDVARAGTQVTIGFSTTEAPSQTPVVTVAGGLAMQAGRNGTTFLYTYTVAGNEPAGMVPVVVTARFMDGMAVTEQTTLMLDFTAPQSPPITVMPEGGGAFVSSPFAAESAITVDGMPATLCQVCVARDGRCDTEWRVATATATGCSAGGMMCSDGDVVRVGMRGRLSADAPWTEATALTRLCDALAPTVGMVEVVGPRAGNYVRSGFSLRAMTSDGAGSGLAGCDTCVTNTATCGASSWVPGTVGADGTCTGMAHTCNDGRIRVGVRVRDVVGHQVESPLGVLTCDNIPPTAVGITAGPLLDSSYVVGPFTISGQFSDVGAGIAGCESCASTDGTCDSEWQSGVQAGLSCQSPPTMCMAGQVLTLQVRARDALGTDIVTTNAVTSRCDSGPPGPPRNVRLTATGPDRFDLAWDAPAMVPGAGLAGQPYVVSYVRDNGPPYDGTDAAEGASPLMTSGTTQRLTGLRPCSRYGVAVAASDAYGRRGMEATAVALTTCEGTLMYRGVTTSYVVGSPAPFLFGDLNADGIMDIVTLDYNDRFVKVALGGGTNGRGDGDLTAATTVPLAGDAVHVLLGDMNDDGILDLVTTETLDAFDVLRGEGANGRGTGTFAPATRYTSMMMGRLFEPRLGDVNNDGLTDVVAMDWYYDSLRAFVNNGNGADGAPTFTEVVTDPGMFIAYYPGFGESGLLADVDGDGNLDYGYHHSFDELVFFRGLGDGTFELGSTSQLFSTGEFPSMLSAVDANNDGLTDLVLALQDGDGVRVLAGLPDANGKHSGAWGPGIVYPGGGATAGSPAALDDLNRDGALDAFFRRGAGQPSFAVMTGNASGTFNTATPIFQIPYFLELGSADFTSDGLPDPVVSYGTSGVDVLTSQGGAPIPSGTYYPEPSEFLVNTPVSVVTANLRSRYFQDAVLVQRATNNVAVRLVTLSGKQPMNALDAPRTYATGNAPVAAALGDVTGDGVPDLVTANDSALSVSMLRANRAGTYGDGTFLPAINASTGGRGVAVALADINRDHAQDIILAEQTPNNIRIILAPFTSASTGIAAPLASAPTSIAVGDVNGDHIPDVVVSLSAGGLAVLTGQGMSGKGTGMLAAPTPIGGSAVAANVTLADVNSDKILDVIVARPATRTIEVLRGNGSNAHGDGTFANPVTVMMNVAATSLALKDLDNDKLLDLVVTDGPAGVVYVARGNGMNGVAAGTFGTRATIDVDGNPSDVAFLSLDGDQAPDMLVVDDVGSTLQKVMVR